MAKKVSNRRFLLSAHLKSVDIEKQKFFAWIKTLRCYEEIKQ